MKKTLILLAISFVSFALTDVTLAFGHVELTFITASLVYLLTAFLFYDRIRERIVLNSFLIFSFLIGLILLGYNGNLGASPMWNLIIIASVFGYAAGMISKAVTGKKRIISLTLSLALILTSYLTVVSKITSEDRAKIAAGFYTGGHHN